MKANFNKLQDIDNSKNPFEVPDDYFAQFHKEIMDKLPEKEFTVPKKVTMWDKVKPWVYMAAMFIGLYITINFLTDNRNDANSASNPMVVEQMNSGSTNQSDYWSTINITEEEFYQYLESQLIEEGYFDYMYDQYYLN